LSAPVVVHAVGRQGFAAVVLVLQGKGGPWLGVDEGGQLLRLFVGEVAGVTLHATALTARLKISPTVIARDRQRGMPVTGWFKRDDRTKITWGSHF